MTQDEFIAFLSEVEAKLADVGALVSRLRTVELPWLPENSVPHFEVVSEDLEAALAEAYNESTHLNGFIFQPQEN